MEKSVDTIAVHLAILVLLTIHLHHYYFHDMKTSQQ
jgi:hypothetical protein